MQIELDWSKYLMNLGGQSWGSILGVNLGGQNSATATKIDGILLMEFC
jgi:hypothetical protein